MSIVEGIGSEPPCGIVQRLDVVSELRPTFVSVDKELLRRALASAEMAKEFASELLADHDDTLGRTTLKNRMWAEQLEKAIEEANKSITELRQALNFPAN